MFKKSIEIHPTSLKSYLVEDNVKKKSIENVQQTSSI